MNPVRIESGGSGVCKLHDLGQSVCEPQDEAGEKENSPEQFLEHFVLVFIHFRDILLRLFLTCKNVLVLLVHEKV